MVSRVHAVHPGPAPGDEGSSIRETNVASGSADAPDDSLPLDQRLERKLATAAALLARLEPQDARARMLHMAMLRRDEALLDGILAELIARTKTNAQRRST